MTQKTGTRAWETALLYGVLALVGTAGAFTLYSVLELEGPGQGKETPPSPTASAMGASRMRMTEFDAALARQKMDQDGDGKCDICGMPVDQCISSGMLECTMDPDATIGLLGSSHRHAGFAWFKDGALFVPGPESYAKSMFIHVETEQDPSKSGRILHMHATGVPLIMFFESLGADASGYRLFVNGQKESLDTYVPQEGDNILLTTSPAEKMAAEMSAIPASSKA